LSDGADWAIAQRLREVWSTGLTRYSQLVVLRGRVRFIPERESGKIHTELWGSGVYIHVLWFCDEIPPTVRDGRMVTLIGNVQTFNLNSHVAVVNCMHVPKDGTKLGKEIRELIARYVLKPQTYVPEDSLQKATDRITKGRRNRNLQKK
jgi:hypothetical protein